MVFDRDRTSAVGAGSIAGKSGSAIDAGSFTRDANAESVTSGFKITH